MGATDTEMLRGLFEGEPPEEFAATWMKPEQIAGQLIDLLREGPEGRSGENIGAWTGVARRTWAPQGATSNHNRIGRNIVTTIEDLLNIHEIKNLRILYSTYFDEQKIDELMGLLTPDVICEFGPEYGGNWEGHETIRANFLSYMEQDEGTLQGVALDHQPHGGDDRSRYGQGQMLSD